MNPVNAAIVATLAFFAMIVWGIVEIDNREAMRTCEQSASFDTCFLALK